METNRNVKLENLLYLPLYSFVQQVFTKHNCVIGTFLDTEIIKVKTHESYLSLRV